MNVGYDHIPKELPGCHGPLRHGGLSLGDQNSKMNAAVETDGTIAICPGCDADLSDWANRIEKAPAANTPKVWVCPECDVVLGVSDWRVGE